MKQLNYFLSTALIAILLASCSSSSHTTGSGSNGAHPSETALLWYQTSAEYEALCHQAFEVAKNRIREAQKGGIDTYSGKPFAVILDIDETVLDNSPYNVKLLKEGKEYSQDSWDEWVKLEKAELVPGVLDFMSFLRDNSIKAIFISNRKDYLLKNTYNNLFKKGIELTDGDILLDNNTSKSERRELTIEYEVLLLIGDNLADFDTRFEEVLSIQERSQLVEKEFSSEFGNKFIILPNPLYGDWQKSIEKEGRKREEQLQLLQSY